MKPETTMTQQNNNLPLHKTVHWRRLRAILNQLCKYEELNKNDYDMEHITCYRTTGAEMQGENTLFKTLTRRIHLGFK